MDARLRKAFFFVASLPARARFRLGRASFVECAVARTDSELVPVLDSDGRPLGPRLLARHRLTSRPPVSGRPGWALYRERLLDPGPQRFASLECAHCGHTYVVQVLAQRDALSDPDGRPLAPAVEFRADWFRFAPSSFDSPARLSCPRCEVDAEPRLSHLNEP